MAAAAGGETCGGCTWKEYELVSVAYHNNERALHIFRYHGVLPSCVTCPRCGSSCVYYEDRRRWRCTATFKVPKQKKRRYCNFSVADNNGTFLERTRLDAWQVLLFINIFVRKRWCHNAAVDNLGISERTSVDWRSFCSEVCQGWVERQEPIGGPGIIVEIDETYFVKRKFNRGRILKRVWLLGGIERNSSKKFIVPLSRPLSVDVQRRDGGTLIPLIKKPVLPGTTIHTDSWAAYRRLKDYGFAHFTVNHKENFVSPADSDVRTQKIERLWRDVKEWCARPGNSVKYVHQYLGRYVFFSAVPPSERVHRFLEAVKELYPHKTERDDNNNN